MPALDSHSGREYSLPYALSVDPADPSTIFADADALYISNDGGRTWRATKHNAGGFWPGPVLADGSVTYALRAPEDTSCGTCSPGPGVERLFATTDNGLTWQRVASYSGIPWELVSAAGQPTGSIFVVTTTGIFLHRPLRPDVERDKGLPRPYGNGPFTALLALGGRGRTSSARMVAA